MNVHISSDNNGHAAITLKRIEIEGKQTASNTNGLNGLLNSQKNKTDKFQND